jgi:DNA-binding response OmpR family regulator
MSGSVLIVDTSASDAAENARMLSDSGFRVTIATTFDEANRELARMSDLVMVMADVRLGEHNGLHLALRVRRARPRTHIIITDRTRDIVLSRESERLDLTYLVKPISIGILLESMTAKLNQGTQQKRVDRRWPRITLDRDIPAEVGSEAARLRDVSYGGLRFDIRSGDFGLALPAAIEVLPVGANHTFVVRPVWARVGQASGTWTCGAALAVEDVNSVQEWRRFVDSHITRSGRGPGSGQDAVR